MQFAIGNSNSDCIQLSNIITTTLKPIMPIVVSHATPINFCEGDSVRLFANDDFEDDSFE
jgi:hypothetical protein